LLFLINIHALPLSLYSIGAPNHYHTIQSLSLSCQRLRLTKKSDRLVIVLVGLPGRGKSFIARKLQNFLTWRGSECRVFNVGKYRRQAADGACAADFFDSKNVAAAEMRQMAASLALTDMLHWLDNEDGDSSNATSSAGGGGGGGGGRTSGMFTTTTTNNMMMMTIMNNERKDRVGIFDATNSTRERREWVLRECTCRRKRAGKPTGVIFVESICDDVDLLNENFVTKVNTSPDYLGMDPKVAMEDLLSRVQKYEEAYETIEDDTQSYIKIYNLSSKMLVNHIYGRMAKSIVPALMAWNVGTRPVFICRAGQTMNESDRANLRCSMSRSESLGALGRQFRDALFGYMQEECLDFINRRQMTTAFSPDLNTGTSISGVMNRSVSKMTFRKSLNGSFSDLGCLSTIQSEDVEEEEEEDVYVGIDGVTPLPFPCYIMTSTMPRARQTVEWEDMPYPIQMLSNLNPLDKGDFTGQELEEIAVKHPEWYEQLVEDPFYTRFPGGECYGDLTSRLESVVVDIEQQVGPVLVVSHVSVLQVLMAYFRNTPVENCTSIALPLNTVVKFTPAKGGGWQESQYRIQHSPSNSHCDLNSMDNGSDSLAPIVEGQRTPLVRTPVGSYKKINVSHHASKGSPPEAISPSEALPIWGDHAMRPTVHRRNTMPILPLSRGASREKEQCV
jgi:broad specificity phosphatase PhoE